MYKVSCYRNSFDSTSTVVVDIIKFLTTEKYKDVIETYRGKCIEAKQNGEDKPKKVGIPMVTTSGVFTHRDKDHLKEFSQLICIDLDNMEEDRLSELKIALMDYSNVFFIARSASNTGLMVLVKIDCGPERLIDAFRKLQTWFKSEFNVDIDKACSDLARPRFATYDADYYHNADATPMSVPEVAMPKVERTTDVGSPEAEKHWKHLVEAFNNEYVSGNRDNWIYLKVVQAQTMGVPKQTVIDVLSNYAEDGMPLGSILNKINRVL